MPMSRRKARRISSQRRVGARDEENTSLASILLPLPRTFVFTGCGGSFLCRLCLLCCFGHADFTLAMNVLLAKAKGNRNNDNIHMDATELDGS